MSKLEEMARAVCCPSGCEERDVRAGSFATCQAYTYMESVRAALTVLRTPDEGMMTAMLRAPVGKIYPPGGYERDRDKFQAAIDHLLKPE